MLRLIALLERRVSWFLFARCSLFPVAMTAVLDQSVGDWIMCWAEELCVGPGPSGWEWTLCLGLDVVFEIGPGSCGDVHLSSPEFPFSSSSRRPRSSHGVSHHSPRLLCSRARVLVPHSPARLRPPSVVVLDGEGGV